MGGRPVCARETDENDRQQVRSAQTVNPRISQRPTDAWTWFLFWIWTWIGTSLGGAAFGAGLSLFAALYSGDATGFFLGPLLGLIVGLMWAGAVGALVIPTFGALAWMFWCQRNPIVLAAIAGAIIGAVSLPFLFILTAPFGATGAGLIVNRFLKSQMAKPIVDAETERLSSTQRPRFQYSIADLFLRMTVVGVLIVVWSFLIRTMF